MLGRWIPVYASIYDGGKLRALRKALGNSEPECVGLLNALWDWGQLNADEYGFLLHADEADVATALGSKMTGCDLSPIAVVNAMIETEWIERTESGALKIHDWEEWQAPWNKIVGRRKYDRERKRLESEGDYQSGAEPDEPSEKKDDEPKKTYSTGFVEFWKIYPRKVDKGMAYEKYKARIRDGYSDEQLIAAAKAYATRCKRDHTDQKFIKHARTFLGSSLPFTDFLPKEETVQARKPGDNPFAQYKGD